ncbi:hypothetical protein KDA_31240 [Dictyobacter alpinus]|uniref:DUF1398 domain-containing protein n=1 Tax=Dictyobacter alpinus TaxID=2014873 RepID=A0A402B8L6_9CHLR|nr:DUF1398 family protein [Dictyobacter alpinus]GCE27640.1 hypothetical protein KDA_31240 [Dictyobacter alpinus]
MFTLAQMNELHDRLGNAETLQIYLQALNAIGVDTFSSFITDGHSEFLGKDGQKVVSPPAHEILTVATTSNREKFMEHLDRHLQGKTNYLEMSKGLAESGIAKWTFDTNRMMVTYYDKADNEMLAEEVK